MLVTTGPLTIVKRETYSGDDDADPVVWGKSMGAHQGERIEKLVLLDGDAGVILDNFTLHPSINGEASEGSIVTLTCEMVRESKAAFSRSGREYTSIKDKWRVVAVEAVEACGFANRPAPAPAAKND